MSTSILHQLLHRARRCPVACALKIVLLVLFISAVIIAIFYKDSMSIYGYIGFMAAIAYVAILAIATNGNCILKINEDN